MSMLIPIFMLSQTKHTISGTIKDGRSGEDMGGAVVRALGTTAGAVANEYGFYSLTLPAGNYQIVYSYMGFRSDTININLTSGDIQKNIQLFEEEVTLDVVEITDDKPDQNVTSNEMSTITLNLEEIKKMPAFFGEVDVIKTLQLLPGIQSVGEGLSGYYVRGGNIDQNLVLLDEATVFNASHLLGFFSVFNSDALKNDPKIYKGGIPAQYGGRLSSVLDLRMREGNNKKFHASGGIGLISSRLTLEGPIIKDRASFMVSGRRTYGDLFLLLSKNEDVRKSKLYFYDLNAKVNYQLNDRNRIFASGYFGRDIFKFQDAFYNYWGNSTASVRWNHIFSDKLFMNSTLIYSNFKYGFAFEFTGNEKFKYDSGIENISVKSDFTYIPGPKDEIRFGYQGTYYTFQPGKFTPEAKDGQDTYFNELKLPVTYAYEHGWYFNNEHTFGARFSTLAGLRITHFANLGKSTQYRYDPTSEQLIDSLNFNSFEPYNPFWGLEPRLAAKFMLGAHNSIKASYNHLYQYLHLASNSSASFPWDLWVPCNYRIKPQVVDQLAVGYFHNLNNNKFETSVELYYKWMGNQIDFEPGAELLLNPHIETEMLIGRGWAYGSEFYIRKATGKFTGWISYTLSWSWRDIPGINYSRPYRARNDRRHDFSIVANYQLTPRLSLSAVAVYATGQPITLPSARYEIDDHIIAYYSERNGYRFPSYHRLDLSCTLDNKIRKEGQRWKSSWNFSLYNTYGRKNAWAINIENDDQGNPTAKKLYLFRWIPSITYNFSF